MHELKRDVPPGEDLRATRRPARKEGMRYPAAGGGLVIASDYAAIIRLQRAAGNAAVTKAP